MPLKLSMMPETDVVAGFFLSAKGYSYSLEEKMKSSVWLLCFSKGINK